MQGKSSHKALQESIEQSVRAMETAARAWLDAAEGMLPHMSRTMNVPLTELQSLLGLWVKGLGMSGVGSQGLDLWKTFLSGDPALSFSHLLSPDALQADEATRLLAKWKEAATVYLKDLERMAASPRTHTFELPAMDAEAAAEYMSRLQRSLQVKARYGPEYYADPEEVEVGPTPSEVVWEDGHVRLLRYHRKDGKAPDAGVPPLLLVYSIINRPYILDLVPGVSLIEHLVDSGLTVFLLDWGEPTDEDSDLPLDELVEGSMKEAQEFIRTSCDVDRVSQLGYCIGGVLAVMYAALYPEELASLITLTTPITGEQGGIVSFWADPRLFPLQGIVAANGNVPGKLLRYTFTAFKPYVELQKWKTFYENLLRDDMLRLFLPIDKWSNDNPDVPGKAFLQFVQAVYHEDSLKSGRTEIAGRRVDLSRITCPLLNIVAKKDWIVTPESAAPLNELVGSSVNRLEQIPGPHVGIIMDPRTRYAWDVMVEFLRGN
ncbi:alpha/beta fold hydrolase [Planctomycetota bacterium]